MSRAAFALGMPRWRVSLDVCLRAVKGGVITGVLLAVARIAGETAPLAGAVCLTVTGCGCAFQ